MTIMFEKGIKAMTIKAPNQTQYQDVKHHQGHRVALNPFLEVTTEGQRGALGVYCNDCKHFVISIYQPDERK